jgi:transposase
MNGIFWVLRYGTRWKDLPGRYPPYQTCHRNFLTRASSDIDETSLFPSSR